MPSKKARRKSAAGKSTASISDKSSGKKAVTNEPENDSKTSALDPQKKKTQALPTQTPNEPTISGPSNPPTITICAVCTRIGRTLPCCASLPSTSPCTSCASMAQLLAKEAADPQYERQVKEARIDTLRQATKQFEAENERLNDVLAQKKKVLQEKRDELYRVKPEGPKILKKMGRARAAKKKEEEEGGVA